MGFAEDIQRFADKTKLKIETVVRKAVIDLQGGVVLRSPVDTGRFRSNWMAGIGTFNKATTTDTDKTGAVSLARVEPALANWSPGQAICLSNSLPYAYRLEFDGWSKQSPGGMVRLTVQDWRDYVSKAIAEVK
ncbi:MAG: HK97 gp10 family phage protein [Rubrivivax sp.]|nr:MAG: HK97 gp10 family phage protein [Rubrivivax sp.]